MLQSGPEACCKFFRSVLQEFVQNDSSVFQTYVASMYDLDDAYVSHICCKSMFEMFQSYVAISVFMLQVASVLSGCCICFKHMLQVYVPNVSSASDLCCIQVFYVVSVSCFGGMFRESWGMARAPGKGRG